MSEEDRVELFKQELTGYREPAGWERECISRYLCRELKKEDALKSIWHAFTAVCAAMAVIGTIRAIMEEPIVNAVIYGIWFVLMALILYRIRKGTKKKNMLIRTIQNGKFRVMDCLVYQVYWGRDIVGGAEVQIYNASGQYCKNRFVVDIQSAKESQTNNNLPFVLMRCDYGDNAVYFELFSERKLGGRN